MPPAVSSVLPRHIPSPPAGKFRFTIIQMLFSRQSAATSSWAVRYLTCGRLSAILSSVQWLSGCSYTITGSTISKSKDKVNILL